MSFEFNNPEVADAFEVLFRGFFKATWFWWRVWILTAELRIMIQMFLNINTKADLELAQAQVEAP